MLQFIAGILTGGFIGFIVCTVCIAGARGESKERLSDTEEGVRDANG